MEDSGNWADNPESTTWKTGGCQIISNQVDLCWISVNSQAKELHRSSQLQYKHPLLQSIVGDVVHCGSSAELILLCQFSQCSRITHAALGGIGVQDTIEQ